MPKQIRQINTEEIYRRWSAGESLRKMAPGFGFHYTSLSARLKKAGFNIVKRYLSGEKHPSWKGSTFIGECPGCGKQFIGHKRYTQNTQRFCSLNCSQAKENNGRWKGGLASPLQILRGCAAYKRWAKAIKNRDNWACILCGSTEKLHADHIKSFTLFPELRFELTNGRTLCKSCHIKTDNYGWKFNYGN